MSKNSQQNKSYGSTYGENYTTLSSYTEISYPTKFQVPSRREQVPSKFQMTDNEIDNLIKNEGWKLQQVPCQANEKTQVLATKNRILYRCVLK